MNIYNTDLLEKQSLTIITLINIVLLPQIPPLSHDFSIVELDWATLVDVELNSWTINITKVLQDLLDCFVEVTHTVLVLHVGDRHVDLVLRRKVNTEVIFWDLVGKLELCHY